MKENPKDWRERLTKIREDGFELPPIVENIVMNERLMLRKHLASNLKVVVKDMAISGTESEYMDGYNQCVRDVAILINTIFYDNEGNI